MLPNRKSNRVKVDENLYQYVVTEAGAKQGAAVPLSITVQHRETNGAHLRVVGLTASRLPEKESKYSMGRTMDRSVEPRHVAQIVRLAISRGWKPELSGPPFVLFLDDSEVFGESGGV